MSDIVDRLEKLLDSCFFCGGSRKVGLKNPENTCPGCRPLPDYPVVAPEGQIFVCGACGKRSKTLYGDGKSLWDESCMVNAVMVKDQSVQLGNEPPTC